MKTKDYSKVKYVKPSVDGTDITKGKVYEFDHIVNGCGRILKDAGSYRQIIIYIPDCAHIDGKRWIPCDKDGNEI